MSNALLDDLLLLHSRLTPAVVTILQSVLHANSIEYLAVSGRTKDRSSAIEKIKRKGYGDFSKQMTDLSGIRVVLFSESDVKAVSDLMPSTFAIDKDNSLDQDELLSANQMGYRSIHFVCELGSEREVLPEFIGLAKLKFEVQIRTVLQHAWAELSHDRNYKFGGTLPRELERRLYLYAGLLEIADKGFDELAKSIDTYVDNVKAKTDRGDLDTEVNSITLRQFVRDWAQKAGVELEDTHGSDNYNDLVRELEQFKVKTLEDLKSIIPTDYAEHLRRTKAETNIYRLLRDWMLFHDWRRFETDVKRDWVLAPFEEEQGFLASHLESKDYKQLVDRFGFGHLSATRD